MSRSVIFRLALALAVIVGLSPLPGVASAAGSAPRAGALEPTHLTPRALDAWRWRQALDPVRGHDFAPGPAASLAPAAPSLDGDQVVLNDTTGVVGTDQDQLAIVSHPGHNIVLVWRDVRFGDGDVRALVMDPSGRQILPPGRAEYDFVVNDDGQGVDQQRPAVAMNAAGEFVVVWSDGRQGSSDIWLQRFRADGSAVGANMKVNTGRDDDPKFSHTQPGVAISDAGEIAVAWLDDRTGTGTDVYAARIGVDNIIKVAPFLVSGPVGPSEKLVYKPFDCQWPALAYTNVAGDSSFVIAWQARNLAARGSRRSIFGRLFNTFHATKGTPLDQVVALLDDRQRGDSLDLKAAARPALLSPVGTDTSLSYTAAWVDSTPGTGVIRARRVSLAAWRRTGNPGAESSVIASDTTFLSAASPALSRLADGSLSVSWFSQLQADGLAQSVHGRLLSAALAPLGPSQRLNSSGGVTRRGFPRTAAFGTESEPQARLAAWIDRRSGTWDVEVRALGTGASADSALVRDRQADQVSPNLSFNSSGKGVAVWTDFRAGLVDPDIYGQVLNSSGAPVGANFRINSDLGQAFQDHPVVAVDSLGAFTVMWEDARSGNFLVYVRRFGPGNAPLGTEVPVAPPGAGAARDTFQQFRPALASTPGGACVAAWEDNRRSVATGVQIVDVRMTSIDAAGVPKAPPIQGSAGDSTTGDPSFDPSVAVDPVGNGLLFYSTSITRVLESGTITNKDVDGRFFLAPLRMAPMVDPQGRYIASQAFSVADTLGSGFLFSQNRASVGCLDWRSYVVAFQDERLGTTAHEDIRAQLYRVQALVGDTVQVFPDGRNFLVNDDTVPLPPDAASFVFYLSASQYDPMVAIDPAGGAFTVLWSDRRTGSNYNIMRQSYHVEQAASAASASRVRQLGRNLFVNSDTEIQDAVHGAAVGAYAGPGQLAATWQSDRIKYDGYDIYSRQVTQAPDTCTNDNCLFTPRLALTAALDGQAVRLSWNVPAGSGGGVQLLRYELASHASQSWYRPALIGQFPAAAGAYSASDLLPGDPGGYLYELVRDGAVVASAVPSVVKVRYALGLSAVTPNPARGSARIAFTVPGLSAERVPVKLHVYDVTGRRLRTLTQDMVTAGPHAVSWSGDVDGGGRAGTGVYFLRLEAGGQTVGRKVLWLR